MATKKKMLQAAAGNAGAGAGLDVDDVFSTYLYTGNGSTQTIANGIELGSSNAGGSADFASGEYLVRNSDFTSNSDGKTFTLSAWVFWQGPGVDILRFGNSRLVLTQNYFECVLYNSGGSKIIDQNISLTSLSPSMSDRAGSWVHVLLSLDVNSASGKLYISDTAVSWSVSISNNSNIDFTKSTHYMHGNEETGRSNFSSVYLDYTYRNLATESNRRIFIDSSGYAVSGLESNNPIIYMPFSPDYEITKNLGTGGDFSIGSGSPSITTDIGPFNDTSLGEGGLVWIKNRDRSIGHALFDTERGANRDLNSDDTSAENYNTTIGQTFNSNGFSLDNNYTDTNYSGEDFASWTWRKAPKFFDVVTYTGTGSAQSIAHNLGTTVGFFVIKRTDTTGTWFCYHDGLSKSGNPRFVKLNEAAPSVEGNASLFNLTYPTSTHFTVGTNNSTNASGGTYVAYLWAHNDGDGGFGPDGDQDIIKCGSLSLDSNGYTTVDLGFEPQWVMIKSYEYAHDWRIYDVQRGANALSGASTASGSYSGQELKPNENAAEATATDYVIAPNATGFSFKATGLAGAQYDGHIYIAIRRPTAVPTSATEVFATNDVDNGASAPDSLSGFPVDMYFRRYVNSTNDTYLLSRLTGTGALKTNGADAEASFSTSSAGFDYNNGVMDIFTTNNTDFHTWMWKRAPKYFDVVAYTGNGIAGRTVSHNLGVAPEMMWVKARSKIEDWSVYHAGITNPEQNYLYINNTGAVNQNANTIKYWNHTNPTDSVFTLGDESRVNASGHTYIAYLFASLDGISKVGSYTGTGSAINVDCGFSNGARFVIIKRSSGIGNWYLMDSERGIVAGNDPALYINSSAAQITTKDLIDPYSAGFTVTTDANVNNSGFEYIFYAIAQ